MRTRGGPPLTSSRLREGSGQKDKRSKGPKPPLTGRNWPLGEVCGSSGTHRGRRNAPQSPVARPVRRNGVLPANRERCVPGPARGLGGDWGSCTTCRQAPNLRCARCLPPPWQFRPTGNWPVVITTSNRCGLVFVSSERVGGSITRGAWKSRPPPPKPVAGSAWLPSAARRQHGESWARWGQETSTEGFPAAFREPGSNLGPTRRHPNQLLKAFLLHGYEWRHTVTRGV